MRKIGRILGRSLALLALILLLAIGCVAMLLNTESGSRFLIARIAPMVPGSLYVDGVEGTLWRDLDVRVLRYRSEQLELQADELQLMISWPGALAGNVDIERLAAREIIYRSLAEPEEQPSPLAIDVPPLPVGIHLAEARIDEFRFQSASAEVRVGQIRLDDFAMRDSRVRLGAGSATVAGTEIDVSDVAAELGGDVPVSANVSWRRPGDGYAGQARIAGSLQQLEIAHELSEPYEVSTSGTVQLLGRTTPFFDLETDWQEFEVASLKMRDGDVSARGTPDDYTTRFTISLEEPRIPAVRVSGSGMGSTRGFSQAEIELTSEVAEATASGSFAWRPALSADVSLAVESFDPAVVDEQLSGSVSAAARVVMSGLDYWHVTGTRLYGTLNDAELEGSGEITVAPARIACESCTFSLGRNRFSADGMVGDTAIAMDVDVAAPTLGTLWDEIGGSLTAKGRVEGTRSSPRFTGTVGGDTLSFGTWSADTLAVDSRDSDLERFDLTLSATEVRRGETLFGSLEGDVQGDLTALQVDAQWRYGDAVTVTAEGSLARTDSGISGTLRRAEIEEKFSGRWVLENPLSFVSGANGIVVDEHRWQLPEGHVEVSRISTAGGQIEVVASLADLPLAAANAFLPADLQLSGTADATFDVTRIDEQWAGSVHWEQDGTVLHVRRRNEETLDLQIPEAVVDAELAGGGAEVVSIIRVDPGARFRLSADVATLRENPQIDARLVIDGEEWAWLSSVIPVIDNFAGDLSANIRATGPLQSPRLAGEISWADGSIFVPVLNVPFTNVNLVATGERGGSISLSGGATAGDGELAVSGQFENILADNRRLELSLSGQNAEIIDWPEYHLWASPDLEIRWSAAGLVVNGDVHVPGADIAVRDLPEGAVEVSPDVRIAGVEEAPEEETAMPLRATLQVTLGEDVHVAAFGLETDLEGSLAVRKLPEQPVRAEGRVELIDGVFAAYGQRLTIREGTLTFTGPLDNPIVDVTAIRTIENFEEIIVAGIEIGGRANNLTSSVFSEPAMSEADALSYLMIGRPLAQATESEGGDLSTAAVGLGLRQASRLTQEAGESVGLDQLSIIGDGGDATALVAGKQINSRLYARYAYGVFSRVGKILLRYKLSDRLSLEAGAGEAQSLDIVYSVEQE